MNSNIDTFLSSFTLKIKTQHAYHLKHIYADYVELVALFSNLNPISATTFLDRLSDEGIGIPNVDDSERAIESEKRQSFGFKVFNILEERANIYENDYPFIFQNRLIRIKDKKDLTSKNKIYLILLLSSNLDIFGKFNSWLTSDFEIVSSYVLRDYLPEFAIVKTLGNNSDYSGYSIDKIRNLADDMQLDIDEKSLLHINPKATKEKGLDLIGWIPSNDKAGNIFTLLCQCACGKDWFKKQNETKRYLKYIKFSCLTPTSVMFIPYALVSNNISSFYQYDEISEQLIFERKRIIHFLKDTTFLDDLHSSELIEKLIDFEEDIV